MSENNYYHQNNKKRSKKDEVSLAVATYLTKRNYAKKDASNISKEQMNLSFLINNEISNPNSIVFGFYEHDSYSMDSTFNKFSIWIKSLVAQSSDFNELEAFLPPLFCYFFLDLQTQNRDPEIANEFFLKYEAAVKAVNKDKMIEHLINSIIGKLSDCETSKKHFKSNKYFVQLSSKSFHVLKKYLSESSHLVLLQTFQSKFDIQEITEKPPTNEYESEPDHVMTIRVKDHINGQQSLSCDNETNELLNAIAAVKKNKWESEPKKCIKTEEQTNGYQSLGYDNQMNELHDAIAAVKNDISSFYDIHISNVNDIINCGIINQKLGLCVYSYSNNIVINLLDDMHNELIEVGDLAFRNHSDIIFDMDIIPSNKLLLSASADHNINLYNLNDFSHVQTYKEHNFPVYKVVGSSNGAYFVSGCYDSSCRLWSIETANTLRLYAGHYEEITALDFHPNSLYFVSGSTDKSIRMWTINDGTPVRLFVGSLGPIYAAKYNHSGKLLATAGEDTKIRIWDLVASKQMAEIDTGREIIRHLEWSDDDSLLCSGGIDGVLLAWDIKTILNNPQSKNYKFQSIYSLEQKLLDLDYSNNMFGCLSSVSNISVIN